MCYRWNFQLKNHLRKSLDPMTSKPEPFNTTLLKIAAWGLPGIQTIVALGAKFVDADELLGKYKVVLISTFRKFLGQWTALYSSQMFIVAIACEHAYSRLKDRLTNRRVFSLSRRHAFLEWGNQGSRSRRRTPKSRSCTCNKYANMKFI